MRHRKKLLGIVLGLAMATLAMDTEGSAATATATKTATPTIAPPGGPPPGPDPGLVRAAAAGRVGGHFYGRAFDTCQAPSADTMRRWQDSDYGAVGVYFGGRGRACPNQRHLSRDWLRSVDGMGWGVLPLYVGSQSPCVVAQNKQHVRIGRNPARQGAREGADAVGKAQDLGIAPDSPLYLDMESYRQDNRACARDTLAFVRAWNREVRGQGYVPGFYSSANSGVRHMDEARRQGVEDLPEVMWFARWNIEPDLYGEPALGRDSWLPNRRIHQYAGNVTERHGGRTITIDRNLVDAPVATLG
ncbi:DUF1906 domain-containing protein [Streptomyces flavofungini]|uniref:DUF1906 domain-containing protein n=1 Tax=Streptomyces flavofungini TaxID=68200 RepID=A0ABS0WYN8_9ACTN|nr:DUF1906 domain-containing protein [Streptomyces flavofungini]MBJ3806036.1 DUF1906 domain-containing protein [Streptomyces flavofungini]